MRRSVILFIALVVTSISALAAPAVPQNDYVEPGRYEIVIGATGKVLDLRREDFRTVQQWERGRVKNQQWDFESAGDNNYYIRSAENGGYLTVDGTRDGARLIVGRSRDVWRIEPFGNGEVIIIHRSGQAIDVPNANPGNGVPLQIWGAVRNNNQRFRLVRVGNLDNVSYNDRNPGPYGPGYNRDRSDYDNGYRAGVNDNRTNLSRDYRRYRNQYNRQSEIEFRQGYNAGYDNGANNDGYDNGRYNEDLSQLNRFERRAYEEGYRLGQADVRAGTYANYRRYEDRYNRQQESFFRRGYEAGYNNARRY